MKPRVLIGCETSGTMKHAFALQGWDAWSCDVLPDDDGDTITFSLSGTDSAVMTIDAETGALSFNAPVD